MKARGTRRLALVTLVALLGLIALMVRLHLYSTIFLVAGATAGVAIFLLVSRRPEALAPEAPGPVQEGARHRIKQVATMAFFLLSAASLLVLVSEVDSKPLAYYVLMAVAGAMITARIGLLDRPREIPATLLMIVLLGLNLFGSDQLSFPNGIGGADSSTHLSLLVLPILQTGYLPPTNPCAFVYGSAPAHHILVASGSLLLGADPSRVYYALGFLVMALPLPATFLVCKTLFGPRTALIAPLLISGSSYYVFWASHASTLTYAIPFIALAVLILLRLLDRFSVRLILLAVLFVSALLLTHPYSSVIFAAILVAILVGEAVKAGVTHRALWGSRIVSGVFAYLLLVHWAYDSCLLTKSGTLLQSFFNAFNPEAGIAPPAVYDTLPISTILANTLGDAFLLALLAVGLFLLLSRGLSTRQMIVIAPAIALVALTAAGIFLRVVYLLPNRIYVFLQFLAIAPLGAVAFRYLWRRIHIPGARSHPAATLAVAAAIVGTFVFLSTTSTIAGFETSPLSFGQPYVKLYNTQYEADAARWACANLPPASLVQLSRSLVGNSREILKDCVEGTGGTLDPLPISAGREINVPGLSAGSVVIFDRYDVSPGYQLGIVTAGRFGQGVYDKLSPQAEMQLSSFDRVYDNGVVQAYIVGG